MTTEWDKLAYQALRASISVLKNLPGVVLAFHSVADGLKVVDPQQLDTVLGQEPDILAKIEEGWGVIPTEIVTPSDFFLCLAESMRSGLALQRMIHSETTFRWCLEKIGYDELRLGGTSANMAVSLAPLLSCPVLVYANPLPHELAALFPSCENIITVGADGEVGHPTAVASGDGLSALHLIMEYKEGQTLHMGERLITASRDNRFIAAWNPTNNRLELSPAFSKKLLETGERYSHLLISGFHILSEHYSDGATGEERVALLAEYIGVVRKKNPHLKLHVEMASIGSDSIRLGLVKHVLTQVHSLGINEVELTALMDDTNGPDIAEGDLTSVIEGLLHLADLTALSRIHFHTLDYFVAVADMGYVDRESVRTGLLTASLMAAVRASKGSVSSIEELETALSVPVSEHGVQMIEQLGRSFGITSEGLGRSGERHLVVIPTRKVANPVMTVGLGDAISSVAFLSEKLK